MRANISLLTVPILIAAFGVTAVAADPPAASAAPAAPSLTDVLTASGIAATGYISTTYQHFSGVPTYRQFDVDGNGFSLGQAGLQLAYQPREGFGGVVQLTAGNDAAVVNTAEGSSASNFDVLQAYAQYARGPMDPCRRKVPDAGRRRGHCTHG